MYIKLYKKIFWYLNKIWIYRKIFSLNIIYDRENKYNTYISDIIKYKMKKMIKYNL